MKLIEKLAGESAPPYGKSHNFSQQDQLDSLAHVRHKEGFIAGFLKAREMASDLSAKGLGTWQMVLNIGEEEV